MDTNKMRDLSREQFEAWYLETHCGGPDRVKTCSNDHNTYYYTDTQTKWVAWQASRESVVIDLPDPNEVHDSGDYCAEAIDAIEAQGLKVKP
ncbi:hypothetical protein [Pseudomonas sp. NMI1173_11]|uniref:hypothetical protein n=1 Tax=Pseudomonas sp. NMI1173_11 TaxID=2903145 RepID=UPI001E333748|nr:hypothetical protein [Pseudomonas sp. NMI1173_11]MCE0999994.1 hypothetical protein [Pseudomonas sp. NMI1173_11]